MELLEDRTLLSTTSLSGPESLAHPTIPVFLTVPPQANKTVTINYSVAGGTAVSGKDFTLAPGKLTFNPGETVKNIPLTILDDGQYETNKTVQIKLTATAGVNLGTSSVLTYTILENDPQPSVGFSQTSASGPTTQNASLPVSLSTPSSLVTTVNYAVTGGSATSGVDYKLAAGTLTFKAGQTVQNLSIPILNAKIDQPNQTIQVSLSSPTNAGLGGNTVFTYTIVENNPPPSVAFVSATSSGPESTANPAISVALSSASGKLVTVQYAVSGGSAVNGTDYTLTAGTLTFQPGVKTQNLPITVRDDRQPGSPSKTVQVTLSTPGNATLGKTLTSTYTIQDNDPNISFAQASASGPETTSTVSLPVVLSGVLSKAVTVHYAVVGGTAVSGVNYKLPAGTLTINPNSTSASITLSILDDHVSTANKTVQVQLSGPTNAKLGNFAVETYTIVDTDPLPAVGFSQTTASGPESKNASLPVVLSAASGQTVNVGYAVTGGTALNGVDYKLAAGTLSFKPGQTTQSLSIPLLNDHLIKPDQTIQVTLSAPSNAVLGSNSVFTFTIQNSNTPPNVSFVLTKSSGSEASPNPSLQVALSTVSGKTVTVHYAATGGTAVSGVNYTLPSGTLTFNPGDMVKTIPLTVLDEGHVDPSLTVQVTLDSPNNATLGKNTTHTFTILDADSQPTVAFPQASASGPESVASPNLQVALSAGYNRTVTVNYAVTGGTAIAGTDYRLPAGTLTFNPGDLAETLPLTIVADSQVEPNETIQITLSSPNNASLGGIL